MQNMSNKVKENTKEPHNITEVMKQFKILTKLVGRLKVAADASGTLDDLCKHREADDNLVTLKNLLSEVDEFKDKDNAEHKYLEHERESLNSWVERGSINFYWDEDEAQELILDEDRLTYRYSHKDSDNFKGYSVYDDEYTKYQKLRKTKSGTHRDRLFSVPFSSGIVWLRYMVLLIIFWVTIVFVYVQYGVMDYKSTGRST